MRGGWKQKLYLTVFNLLDLKQKTEKILVLQGKNFPPYSLIP